MKRTLAQLIADARKYARLARRMRYMARDPGLARRYARLAAAAHLAVMLEIDRLVDEEACEARSA